MRQALEQRPVDATHWSVRSFARATRLSKSTVHRYFTRFGIQLHRSRHFNEKTQIQALERSQPVLSMGLGYVDGITHDYFRHRTTTLFAALDVATGTVIGQCIPRHRHQELLSFLNHIERNVPGELDVHVVMDNGGTPSD